MLGIQNVGVVIVGSGFPVAQVDLDVLFPGGKKPESEIKMPQIIQAQTEDYQLVATADRFQLFTTKITSHEESFATLRSAALAFLREYVTARAVSAVGFNFIGRIETNHPTATELLQHIALPGWYSDILHSKVMPTPVVITRVKLGDEDSTVLQLEPATDDPKAVSYAINVNWGSAPPNTLESDPSSIVGSLTSVAKPLTDLLARISQAGATRDSE